MNFMSKLISLNPKKICDSADWLALTLSRYDCLQFFVSHTFFFIIFLFKFLSLSHTNTIEFVFFSVAFASLFVPNAKYVWMLVCKPVKSYDFLTLLKIELNVLVIWSMYLCPRLLNDPFNRTISKKEKQKCTEHLNKIHR